MNISTVSASDSNIRKNLFIKYANQFMSFKANPDKELQSVFTKPNINPVEPAKKIDKSMGIETLTIFPKEVIAGKTIITA